MMKYLSTALLMILAISFNLNAQEDKTLLTIDDRKISKEEFQWVYNKNNSPGNNVQQTTVDEYLDMFINYKLKVIEAENQGLDTLESFTKEYNKYKKQLVQPYLTDESIIDSLVREAYERTANEVSASHILVKVKDMNNPEDTLAAYNKISEIRRRILKGEDFKAVAKATSDDPYAKINGGYLGYFGAFMMVYPFETVAFTTPKGEVSKPFSTQYGYHIIQVHDKRQSPGKIKVAHIMAMTNQKMSEAEKDSAEAKIKMVFDKLEAGESFEKLAKEYSDDRRSGSQGGELPWFSAGQYVPDFVEAAYSIENTGDYSEPIKTFFGWHIIKKLDERPVQSFEEVKEKLTKKVKSSKRADREDELFSESLKIKYGFNENPELLKVLAENMDKDIYSGNWSRQGTPELNTELLSIGDSSYTLNHFVNYLLSSKMPGKPLPVNSFINKKYDKFAQEKILNYEENKLPEKYPEFKYLLQEYHDGILLFDLMDKEVWKKAAEDSAGLEKYYDAHKEQYQWEKRIEVAEFSFNKTIDFDSKKWEKSVKRYLRKPEKYNLAYFTDQFCDTTDCVSLQINKYEKEDYELADQLTWKEGSHKIVNKDESSTFYLVKDILDPQPKKLNEARGLVISDYQKYLEDEWVKELREKYDIEVHQDVLSELIKETE
jgi:peptidyl-prolyl cis-trans isomerase SurA